VAVLIMAMSIIAMSVMTVFIVHGMGIRRLVADIVGCGAAAVIAKKRQEP